VQKFFVVYEHDLWRYCFIESLWEQALIKAKRKAEAEMNCKSNVFSLTWKEVFEDEYVC
jgi:hypothetical protein